MRPEANAAFSHSSPRAPYSRLRTHAQLFALASSQSVIGLVVGWPLELDGSEGRQCEFVRDYLWSLFSEVSARPGATPEGKSSSAQEKEGDLIANVMN